MRKSTKREDRISTEVVVDVYTSEERAIGWYSYLGGTPVSVSRPVHYRVGGLSFSKGGKDRYHEIPSRLDDISWLNCRMVKRSLLHAAVDELKLDRISVVYPGTSHYDLAPLISVVPLTSVVEGARGIFPTK